MQLNCNMSWWDIIMNAHITQKQVHEKKDTMQYTIDNQKQNKFLLLTKFCCLSVPYFSKTVPVCKLTISPMRVSSLISQWAHVLAYNPQYQASWWYSVFDIVELLRTEAKIIYVFIDRADAED